MDKIKPLGLNDVLTQSPGNIVSDMDGEKVMLSVRRGKYYNLGEVGGHIWDMLAGPVTAADIVDRLTRLYQVDYAKCRSEVMEFLDHLQEEELLVYADAGTPAARAATGG